MHVALLFFVIRESDPRNERPVGTSHAEGVGRVLVAMGRD